MSYLQEVSVSRHAVTRFKQRAKLFLYENELNHPVWAIKKLIKDGYLNLKLINCPFYKNKLGCDVVINGRFKFYIRGNVVVTFILIKNDKEACWRR